MAAQWSGVFPAVTTQFRRDQSLDAEATARHLEALIASGVSGLVVCGSLGENQTLDPEEKRAVGSREMAFRKTAHRSSPRSGLRSLGSRGGVFRCRRRVSSLDRERSHGSWPVKISNAVDLLATYGTSGPDMKTWLDGVPVNRDFSLKLEYISGLALNAGEADPIYEHMIAGRSFPPFTGQDAALAELRRRLRANVVQPR